MKDHRLIDERSLAFARVIAAKVQRDPALVEKARGTFSAGFRPPPPGVTTTLREWQAILQQPVDQVLAILTSPDERSTRLRQSNPFTGIITPEERLEIVREYEARDRISR